MSIERAGRSAAGSGAGSGAVREPVRVPITEPGPTPEAIEFIRFCYRRSGVTWPALYDEMCAVAARGAFRGLEYEDLGAYGISFALTELPRMAAIAELVVSEELAASRPVVLGQLLAVTGQAGSF